MSKQEKIMERPSIEQIEAELHREKSRGRMNRFLRSTAATILIAAACAILIATLWMPVLRIYGASMQPTLQEGDIVVTVKANNLKQGDLVAFYIGNKLQVKRCIAGPSDWVSIDKDGNIYVNDVLLDEPYLSEKALGESDLEYPYQVPENKWFLVGDHRSTSVDSRSSAVGCIAEDQLVGKLVLRIWPLNQLSALHK